MMRIVGRMQIRSHYLASKSCWGQSSSVSLSSTPSSLAGRFLQTRDQVNHAAVSFLLENAGPARSLELPYLESIEQDSSLKIKMNRL